MDVSNILPSLSKFPSCTRVFSCCETARQGYDLCLGRWGGESTTNHPRYEQLRYIMELRFKCQGDVLSPFTPVRVEAVARSPHGRWVLVAAGLGRLLLLLKLGRFWGGWAPCKRPRRGATSAPMGWQRGPAPARRKAQGTCEAERWRAARTPFPLRVSLFPIS